MSRLFVTGVGTDIGKTYISCRLIEALRARGRAVEALKPIVSGYDDNAAEESDPVRLLAALGRTADSAAIARMSPWRFKAPLAADMAARLEGKALRFEDVADLCRAHTGAPLVIEGAGGVMSPLTDDKTVLDLIAALGGPTILVTGTYLGAISHTLTALEALRRRDVVLLCVIVNESAADNVNLEETVRSLRAQAPQETFAPVARNARLPESIVDLIAVEQ